MDEEKLLEKLRRIEALFAGATTDGERIAAAEARKRILNRLHEVERADPPIAYRFSLHDPWARKVFIALLRRYDLEPYRLYGQHRTTVMVRVPRRFLDETLWPEFQQIQEELKLHLEEITQDIIETVIHEDTSDVEEVAEPRRLDSRAR